MTGACHELHMLEFRSIMLSSSVYTMRISPAFRALSRYADRVERVPFRGALGLYIEGVNGVEKNRRHIIIRLDIR
jgi:hypothetical protein